MKTTNECRVELIGNMGSDLTVVNAARVSFDKQHEEFQDKDKGLINYLAKHNHWTPFAHNRYTFDISVFTDPDDFDEVLKDTNLSSGMVVSSDDTVRHSLYGWAMLYNKGVVWGAVSAAMLRRCPVSWGALTGKAHSSFTPAEILEFTDGDSDPELVDITLRETVPIFVARQRFKHMVGFAYNEVSRRYVDDEPEFFVSDEWRGKPKNAKQGSDGVVYPDQWGYSLRNDSEEMAHYTEVVTQMYNSLLADGVCPEQARMVLPQSMMTSYWVTGSLAAWARAYKQRIDPHAQLEIQDLAKKWGDIIQPLFPVSWEALT